MADFGGFEIETPQEVQARIQAQRQQAFQSQDQLTRVLANNDAALDTLFGNPQVDRAQKKFEAVSTAVAEAMDALPETATDVERERARLTASQQALADTDPAAAAQIGQKLLAMAQDEEARDSLRAQDQRNEGAHASQQVRIQQQIEEAKRKAALEEEIGGLRTAIYGTAKKPQFRIFDVNDPQGAADLEQFLQDTPDVMGVVESEDALNRLLGGRKGPGMTNRQKASWDNKGVNTNSLLNSGLEILTILEEFPTANALATKGAGFLDQAGIEFEAASRTIKAAASVNGFEQKNLQDLNTAFAEANITDARLQSLVTNLAYVFAKARDPGGRLSDQDITLAKIMIGAGNTSAKAMANVLRDQIGLATRDYLEGVRFVDEELDIFGDDVLRISHKAQKFNDAVGRVVARFDSADTPDTSSSPSGEIASGISLEEGF